MAEDHIISSAQFPCSVSEKDHAARELAGKAACLGKAVLDSHRSQRICQISVGPLSLVDLRQSEEFSH